MSNQPGIIFNCEFCPPNIPSEKNDFYRCKSGFNVVQYVDRPGAAESLSDEDTAKINAFIENTAATGKSIVGYANNRQGSTGIFCKTPSDTPKTMEKKLQETGSIIWHSVVSFPAEISQQFCPTKKDAEALLQSTLPALFKNSPLDYENIDWFAAFHTNTANRHIHLVFFEIKPTVLDSKGTPQFHKKGKLPGRCFNDFKASVLYRFSKHKLDYFSVRDDIRNGVTSILKNDKATFDELLRRSGSILNDGHFQYARLNATQQRMLDSFVSIILQNNPSVGSKYDEYKKRLMETQSLYLKVYADAHISRVPQNVSNFYSSRKKDLDNRLGNALLSQLKAYALKKNELEKAVGYENGVWQPSKLSPKNRRSMVSRDLARFAKSALYLFLSEAEPTIEGHLQSDAAFRQQLLSEGKQAIYE